MNGGTEKLLAVPKLTSRSEKSMALAVKEALNDWKLEDKVVAMSFDTTWSNTGQKNEAGHLFKVQLGKELLWLACRPHVFEVVIGAISPINSNISKVACTKSSIIFGT